MKQDERDAWKAAWGVGLLLLVLYLLTAQRGAGWQDSGEFQRRALLLDYTGVEGGARAHPLYLAGIYAASRMVPAAAACWAINAFSGLGMALAAACCAWLVHRLTRNTLAAAGAAMLLGVSHMAWWMATTAEVYTWSLALLLLETLLLYDLLLRPRLRTLCWLALVSGIGLSVHNFALLSLPVWGSATLWLIWRCALPPWALMPAGCAWLAGAAPFLALVAGEVCGAYSLVEAINDALFCNIYRTQVLGLIPALPRSLVLANLVLFLLSLASPLWLAAWYGLRSFRFLQPPAFGVCLAALTLIHVLFYARYFVPDQATFSLPALGMLSVWVGVGMAALSTQRRWTARVLTSLLAVGVICPILVYGGGAAVLHACSWEPPRSRVLPFRDEAGYWLLPWKAHEHSAVDFAEAAFSQCGSNDVIYADSTAAGPLLVANLLAPAQAGRPLVVSYYDMWTGNDEIWRSFKAGMATRVLYVVSPVPGYVPAPLLNGDFAFARTGVLYRVTRVVSAPDKAQ